MFFLPLGQIDSVNVVIHVLATGGDCSTCPAAKYCTNDNMPCKKIAANMQAVLNEEKLPFLEVALGIPEQPLVAGSESVPLPEPTAPSKPNVPVPPPPALINDEVPLPVKPQRPPMEKLHDSVQPDTEERRRKYGIFTVFQGGKK